MFVYGLFVALLLAALPVQGQQVQRPLQGKVICLDPGHGGTAETDQYRVGIGGEREEWINLRVARYLQELLEEAGAHVILTRSADVFVPLTDRAALAMAGEADLFLSIHHNATADTAVNLPVLYYHGNASENQASITLAHCIGNAILTGMYGKHRPEATAVIVSDHTIFPKAGAAVLRGTYGIPALIVEASFFTNPAEEERLKLPTYNRKEAEAYLDGIRCFFEKASVPIYPKYSRVTQFALLEVKQEAARMDTIALRWRLNYDAARYIYAQEAHGRYEEACRLLLESVTSFPDSPIAKACLALYADLQRRMGRYEEARETDRRRHEYYP
ncbi:N-acetylmuramoyl-L-alanine amidase [Parapedobacter composti]|uniref:N-acetylmuramoyl-L-alanine amidase n=1 Tax=Parapedobacter composti TaxID=623281 RepID=A0A1I1KKS6_9SPHI|nr:N-acetylmuramoyl-L-alanine amidase [Parapedobacter composti]SFC59278.1 N-acetylmuramoyl-L-alanine amidase [Parapedobacter composti]